MIGLAALALCVIVLPYGFQTDVTRLYQPSVLGLYLPAFPFFYALFQAHTLLNYIDKNKAFSDHSLRALRNIKYSAIVISGIFALGMPYIFYAADRDDAPGIVLLALVILFASIVIATFGALLEKLIQNGLDIKFENDLTI